MLQRPRLRTGGAGAAMGSSSVMTADAGATANSGRAVAATPEPLNAAGAGGVIQGKFSSRESVWSTSSRKVFWVQQRDS